MDILENLTEAMAELNQIATAESQAIKAGSADFFHPADVDQHLWHLELLAIGLLMGAVMIGIQS